MLASVALRWYDGRVYLVLPNATSVDDAVATVLHEVVGHKELRQLFGEHFDTFLDNVFKNADVSIRKRIIELAKKIKDRVHRAVIGAITIRQQKDFQRIGLNISENWVHYFENSRAINEDGHISQENYSLKIFMHPQCSLQHYLQ